MSIEYVKTSETTFEERETCVNAKVLTIKALKAKKDELIAYKAKSVSEHEALVADADSQIAAIDAKLTKAAELEVVEEVPPEEGGGGVE